MTTEEAPGRDDHRLADASDPEWVADLIDTVRDGDIDTTVEVLESLLRRLRKAAKARRALTLVPAPELRKALELRAGRPENEPCL